MCSCPVVVNAGVAGIANVNNGGYAIKGSDGTKVSVGADNGVIWDNSDKLSFLAVAEQGSSAYTQLELLSTSDDAANAKFSGSVNIDESPSDCYFIYPPVDGALAYEASAGAVATLSYSSQAGGHEPFLYGGAKYSASGINAQLNHIGGMLRVKLPDASTIKKITVLGNNSEPLTPYKCSMALVEGGDADAASANESNGSVQVAFNVTAAQGAASSFDVVLDAASLEQINGNYYCYVAMPPVQFTKGFSLIFSDGSSQMYRSFNYTSGGCDFSVEAEDGSSAGAASLRGAIVDIDASEYKGYNFTTSIAVEHIFESDILVGTSVELAGAAMQGYPASVVTEWGVELYNGSGELVRSVNYTNTSGGTNYTKPEDISSASPSVMATQNDWPYLPQGAYTVKPYVKTIYNSEKQYGANGSLSVPALDASKLKATVGAVTSYSYYLLGNSACNNPGTGSSIYNITAGINISDAILTNSKYAVNATVKDKSTSGEPSVATGELSTASQELLAQYDVTEWKAYTLASYIQFDGVTSEATTTVHVTGLPYEAAPPTNSGNHPWSSDGTVTWNSDNVRLCVGNAKSSITKGGFHIPNDIDIKVKTKYYVHGNAIGTTFSLYIGDSKLFETTVADMSGWLNYDRRTVEDAKETTFTAVGNFIKCHNSYGLGSTHSKVYYVTILYSCQ